MMCERTHGVSLAVVLTCVAVTLASCSDARPDPAPVNPVATSAAALSCRAIGAFAGASHYGEHVRRPDPMEAQTLASALAIAMSALARSASSGPPRAHRLAANLVAAITAYQRALREGAGFTTVLEQFRSAAGHFPSECLADRFLPLP